MPEHYILGNSVIVLVFLGVKLANEKLRFKLQLHTVIAGGEESKGEDAFVIRVDVGVAKAEAEQHIKSAEFILTQRQRRIYSADACIRRRRRRACEFHHHAARAF